MNADMITVQNTLVSIMMIITIVYMMMSITNRKNTNVPDFIIDPIISNMYKDELQRMIEYETVYEVDVKFGNNFRNNKGVSPEISNDDLYEIAVDIEKKVLEHMSPKMLNYLSTCFGMHWIYDYIKIHTLSLVLNYADYTIYDIIKQKK